jgi:signal transduction histidine kinase
MGGIQAIGAVMGSERLVGEDARALGERIATIYSRLPGSSAASIINASLIVIVIQHQQATRLPALWLGLVILLSLLRMAAWWRYRQDQDKLDNIRRWEIISIAGSLGAGVLWGVGPLITGGSGGINQWLWAFAIGGMSAGAASLHAAHLRTALAFIIPACLPLSAMLLAEGTFAGVAAGAMTLAFIGVTSFTAILFSREFGKLLALRAALERRAVELHDANRRLSREIEDHRETSEALFQSQKMEALGSLTGGFAHDFNNLLMVILGNLDAIGRQSSGRVRKMVEQAVTAAESGANLTSRLLAFARKQTLAPRLVDINAVVADFEGLLRRAVSGSISVEFAYSPKQVVAPVDPAHLEAALLNLVVNARDAMPNGGMIRVMTASVSLDAEDLVGTEARPGQFVTVAVSDNGEGMVAAIAERVFEPFFTTKAERGGTGLGLPQVYGFARQSGGFVRLESEPGIGTIVTLFIPASDEPAPPPLNTGRGSRPRAEQTLSVLLVDDNAGVLAVLSAGMADHGWEVATARDAVSALALIESGPQPDIVVTDIDMPGAFDGLGLERRIREKWPALPVLLISGAPIPAAAIGPDMAFLVKPFRNQALVSKIQELVHATA